MHQVGARSTESDGDLIMAAILYLGPCVLFSVEWYYWKEEPS